MDASCRRPGTATGQRTRHGTRRSVHAPLTCPDTSWCGSTSGLGQCGTAADKGKKGSLQSTDRRARSERGEALTTRCSRLASSHLQRNKMELLRERDEEGRKEEATRRELPVASPTVQRLRRLMRAHSPTEMIYLRCKNIGCDGRAGEGPADAAEGEQRDGQRTPRLMDGWMIMMVADLFRPRWRPNNDHRTMLNDWDPSCH